MPLTIDRPYNPYAETGEYVASLSYGAWAWGNERTLPRYIDNNTAYLSEDLYEQMLLDAQVRANVNLLIYGIIGGGIEVLPASDSVRDKDIAKFIKECLLDAMEETPLLTDVLPDLLLAMMMGNKIAEVVWNSPGQSAVSFGGRSQWSVKRVKVKDRRDVAFYVDSAKNVIGIAVKWTPGVPTPPNTFPAIPNGGNEIVFPLEYYRDNFSWVSWKPKDSDPRGSSIGAAAYDPWWFKQQIKPEWLKYLATSAQGSLVGTLADNANIGRRTSLRADGTTDDSVNGQSAADDLLVKLQQFQNSTVIVVPAGTEIESIQPTNNNGMPFILAADFFNGEITKSMTGQFAATEKDGGSGRSPVVGQEILNLPITYGCMVAAQYLQRFIVNRIMERNFASRTPRPKVVLPGQNKDDFLTASSAVSKLLLTNMIPPSLWSQVFIEAGLPLPSAEDMTKMIDLFWKEKENVANPPQVQSRLASDGQNISERT